MTERTDHPGAEAPPEAELLADAVLELDRLPRTPALAAAVRHLEAAPRVAGLLLRRRGLAMLDAELATGEHWRLRDADRAVARRLGVAEATVRGWRWRRDVFGEGGTQQAPSQDEARKEPSR